MEIDVVNDKCYWTKAVAADKKVYEKLNCLKDPSIHKLSNPEQAVFVSIQGSTSSKGRMVTGVYEPTSDSIGIYSDKTVFKKVIYTY